MFFVSSHLEYIFNGIIHRDQRQLGFISTKKKTKTIGLRNKH